MTVRTESGMSRLDRRRAQPAPHVMIGRTGKRHEDRVARGADRLAQRTARGEAATRGHRADRRNLAGDGGKAARIAIDARNRSQQELGVGMGRVGEDLVHRRDLDDLAGIHGGDAVGDRGDDAEVVGDEDHRHAVGRLELGEEREDLGLDGHVERRRRLVGEQQLRPAGQRHRDHHALPHAAGELVREIGKALARRRDLDLIEQLERRGVGLAASHVAVVAQRLGDLEAHRQDRVQRRHRLLEDHRDAVAADLAHLLLAERDQVEIGEADVPAGDPPVGRRHQAHDGQRGDALAATGLADDRQRLVVRDGEADVAHRRVPAAAGAKRGDEVLDREDRGIRRRHRSPPRSFGSMASRSPSPSMLSEKTTSRMARLGKIDSDALSRMFSKPSRIMPPQVAVGGLTPSPMKLSEASMRIAVASHSDAMTSISATMLGRMWMVMMRRSE